MRPRCSSIPVPGLVGLRLNSLLKDSRNSAVLSGVGDLTFLFWKTEARRPEPTARWKTCTNGTIRDALIRGAYSQSRTLNQRNDEPAQTVSIGTSFWVSQ